VVATSGSSPNPAAVALSNAEQDSDQREADRQPPVVVADGLARIRGVLHRRRVETLGGRSGLSVFAFEPA